MNALVHKVESAIAKGDTLTSCKRRIVDAMSADFPYCDGADTTFCRGCYETLVERLFEKLDCAPCTTDEINKEIKVAEQDFRQWERDIKKFILEFQHEYQARSDEFLASHGNLRRNASGLLGGNQEEASSNLRGQLARAADTEFYWLGMHVAQTLPGYEDGIERVIKAARDQGAETISGIDWRHFSPMLIDLFARQWIDDPSEREVFVEYIGQREALRYSVLQHGGLLKRLGLRDWKRGADTWLPTLAHAATPAFADKVASAEPDTMPSDPAPIHADPDVVQVETGSAGYRERIRAYRQGAIHALAALRANRRQRNRKETIRRIKAQGVEALLAVTFGDGPTDP
ncbi:hypothetical protein F2Q65_09250 [Thiohalocapsa marina]|uniref:Uncharacterized protein n=1 Tax=Thiohalocapsa marina TaxID=424902 RepID=A0A5M8FNP1_9GAMM|nr:hypothetical protein [Thiohalocapsa marina]KAA6185276.1 hypothetical protein F2Q65_09250 [Thiohalocapsa marina]